MRGGIKCPKKFLTKTICMGFIPREGIKNIVLDARKKTYCEIHLRRSIRLLSSSSEIVFPGFAS